MRHSLLFALPFVGASISIILIWHSTTILRWEQIKVELILPIPQLGGDGSSRALWRRSRPPFDLSISVGPDVHAELPRGGVLYRLGDLAKASTKNMPSTPARRAIEVRLLPSTNSSAVRFDILFSDYSGAFIEISQGGKVCRVSTSRGKIPRHGHSFWFSTIVEVVQKFDMLKWAHPATWEKCGRKVLL